MTEIILRPIGVVRSHFTTTNDVPLQGGRATLEIAPAYAAALDGLEDSTHLLVMGWLHRADRGVLKARPMKVDPNAPARGVFATRSPARPNPVSVTVAPLLGRDGLRLEVDDLDLVDGTPLVDLKAYSPAWDGVFWAYHRHRAGPGALADQRLVACLERDLRNFMGPSAQSAAARWGLAAVFVAARALTVDPREPTLRVFVNRLGVTAEALMGLTGAAWFNRRLVVEPTPGRLRIGFELGGHGIELVAACEEPPPDFTGWGQAFVCSPRGTAEGP